MDTTAQSPITPDAVAAGTPDAKGTPYDAAKHVPRMNPKTGRWMPRSPGRFAKRPAAAPAGAPTPAEAPRPAELPPVTEVTADALVELPAARTAPPLAEVKPGAPAAEASPENPPTSASIPEVGPDAGPAGADPARGADARASAAHAGKLAARATYAVTGAVIRDHKAAKPTPAEHTALADTWTAFFEFRGVALVGVFAVGAAVLCYLLEDGRREPFVDFVKGLFRKKPERRAEPVADAPAPATPPPAPASPASVHHVRFPE